MANLAPQILVLFPNAEVKKDFIVGNDGSVERIVFWNTATLGPQPSLATIQAVTQAQIDAAAATKLRNAAKNALDNNRGEDLKIMRAIINRLVNEFDTIYKAVPRPVTSITRSGTTATVTTMGQHGLGSNGTVVTNLAIYGADVAGYNGAKSVTVTGNSTFTYTVVNTLTSPAVGSILYSITADLPPTGRTLAQALAAIKSDIDAGTSD